MTTGARLTQRVLLAALWLPALAAFGWAVAVSVTGGFVLTVAGARISSHRVVPAYLLGVALLFATRRSRTVLKAFANATMSLSTLTGLAVATAGLTLIAGVLFGTFTAVGDAFGYIAQADLWLKAQLFQSQGPVLAMPWFDAAWAFCPLGFRPGTASGTMVPTYAPGLPLLMATLKTLVGQNGVYLVVPVTGAVAVYLTFRLGRLWLDRTTGLLAAALLATSPVFLFQLVQPMSDVPVTAFVLLAIVAVCDATWKGAVGSGLATSIAILVRPNLAPLAVPLAAWVVAWPVAAGLRARVGRLLMFGAAVAPLCLLVAWIQFALYGSPFASGYGRASNLYALANLLPNLARYPRWLLQTHTPFVLLALGAPFVGKLAVGSRQSAVGRSESATASRPAFAWLALMFALSVFLCYAFYIPFEHWTVLRFMLPVLPLLILLAAGTSVALLRRWQPWGRAAIALASVLLVLLYLQTAVRGDAFALRSIYQANFRETGRFLRDHAPRNAAFIGLVQTSSISYYAHRQTIRYDLIAPREFDRAMTSLRSAGYEPYLLLTGKEVAEFSARFSRTSRVGALRCAPRARFGVNGIVQLYDLDDCR